MPVTIEKLDATIADARRFLARAGEARQRLVANESLWSAHLKWDGNGVQPAGGVAVTKESGAVKRASMDLTRALTELRKP